MAREYVIRCEHTAGSVWTPVGLYAIDGEDPRVVRCGDCAHYHERFNGCDEFGDESRGEFVTVEPGGFCAWGETREV